MWVPCLQLISMFIMLIMFIMRACDLFLFLLSQGCKTSLMHCYEVIPEKDACKLYFDLEFYKPANPDADGKSMVMKLIEVNWSKVMLWMNMNWLLI